MDESTGMRYKLQLFIKSHISKFSDEVLKNFEKNERHSRENTNELKNNTMELFSEYSEIVKQSIHDNKIAIETADRHNTSMAEKLDQLINGGGVRPGQSVGS